MMKLLSVLVCGAVMMGCSEQSHGRKERETTHPTLEGTHWMLEAVKGRPTISDGRAAFIELHPKDLSFSGNTGLNGISGTYQTNEASGVRFTLGMSTKMAGSDEAMQQERDLLNVLAETETYRIRGRELSLLVDDQVAALFVAR